MAEDEDGPAENFDVEDVEPPCSDTGEDSDEDNFWGAKAARESAGEFVEDDGWEWDDDEDAGNDAQWKRDVDDLRREVDRVAQEIDELEAEDAEDDEAETEAEPDNGALVPKPPPYTFCPAPHRLSIL